MRFLPLLLSLLLASVAHAAPVAAPEEAGQPLINIPGLQQVQDVSRAVGTQATELVTTAMGFLGVPYRRGGTSADTGFDCSGLVKTVYRDTLGLVLPRVAAQQAANTETVARNDLKPGDLVFFNTMRRAFSHVGIYIGDGKFVHAPRTGTNVRIDSLSGSYWKKRFNGARRVLTSDNTPTPTALQMTEPVIR
ncbi:C40 family peptidase [Rhodoferax sp. 4810]|nr:C40 family peptidase [Rhodoferax jenense]